MVRVQRVNVFCASYWLLSAYISVSLFFMGWHTLLERIALSMIDRRSSREGALVGSMFSGLRVTKLPQQLWAVWGRVFLEVVSSLAGACESRRLYDNRNTAHQWTTDKKRICNKTAKRQQSCPLLMMGLLHYLFETHRNCYAKKWRCDEPCFNQTLHKLINVPPGV